MLLLFFCAGAGAAPYPTEIQLRTAIGGIAPLLKADGIALEAIDAATSSSTLSTDVAASHACSPPTKLHALPLTVVV